MIELGFVFFYILYIGEWIINLFKYSSSHEAYRNISFEKEAYANQDNLAYLRFRKCYAQWRKNYGL